MRARRLCGLTLAVALAHLAAWQLAIDATPRAAPARGGPRRIELARVRSAAASAVRHDAPDVPMTAAVPPPVAAPTRPARPPARTRPGPPRPAGDAPPAAAWPVYPTRTPPPARVHYALAPASGPPGTADLEWSHDVAGFSLRLATAPAGRPAREWVSAGGFDAAGLAPVRLAEREKGRDRRAINFDQAARRVRFSGATSSLAIAPGAQDRWSWVAQLAAIAEAAGPDVAPGTTWQLQVAGLRGELDRWIFRVLPPAPLPQAADLPAARACGLLHLVREPERPYDLRVEAWLAPGLHHFPAGLQMSTPPSSWSLSLWAREGGP